MKPSNEVLVLVLLFNILINISHMRCNVYHIVSSRDQPCSEGSCKTLPHFVRDSNGNTLVSSNATLIFMGGNYTLNDSLNISNTESFSMFSSYNSTTTIVCGKSGSFSYSNVDHVNISGLTFVGCSNEARFVDKLIISSTISLGLNQSESFVINNSDFVHIAESVFSDAVSKPMHDDKYSSYLIVLLEVSYPDLSKTKTFKNLHLGGALFVSNSTVTIEKSIFRGNSACMGGAIFSDNESKINISNSDFTSNSAEGCSHSFSFGWGGVLFVGTNSKVIVYNSTFSNNTSAGDGGVATIYTATLKLSQSIIYNNTAKQVGGVVLSCENSNLHLNTVTLSNNTAIRGGGALASIKGTVTIDNSNFVGNLAGNRSRVIRNVLNNIDSTDLEFCYAYGGSGGAICAEKNCTLVVTASKFVSNSATGGGGVVHLHNQCTLSVRNCTVVNNSAMSGGFVYAKKKCSISVNRNSSFKENAAAYRGGVAFLTMSSNISIEHCIALNNVAKHDSGGVIYAQDNSSIKISFNNFTLNRGNKFGGVIRVQNRGNIHISDCAFQNNTANVYGGVLDLNFKNTVKVYRSSFSNNYAKLKGGVLIMTDQRGDDMVNSRVEVSEVINCTFMNNLAQNGGVMFLQRSVNMTVSGSIFNNNIAMSDGGILKFLSNCYVIIFNSSFSKNTAHNNGILQAVSKCELVINVTQFSNNSVGFNGGGVGILDECHTRIIRSQFIGNTAGDSGGAVYGRKNSSIIIISSTFHLNTALNSGGAVHAQQSSTIQIRSGCNFTHNTADYGGAVRVYDLSFANISDCNFDSNEAHIAGGAMAAYKRSVITVEICSFVQNTANVGGVSIVIHTELENNALTMSVCEFYNNSAKYGGILYVHGGAVSIKNSTFDTNRARFNGGTITAFSNSTIFLHTIIMTKNSAYRGGVMSLTDGSSAILNMCSLISNNALSKGGDLYILDSQANITSSTFHSSFAVRSNGGAIHVSSGSLLIERSLFSHNNASMNGGAVRGEWNTSIVVLYCNFTNNTAVHHGGALSLYRNSNVTVINTNFENNTAESGGALAASSMSSIEFAPIIGHGNHDHVFKIISNRAQTHGGGIYIDESLLNFTTSIIINYNQAGEFGGGIHAMNSSIAFVSDIQFSDNKAKSGGGISLSNSNLSSNGDRQNLTIDFCYNQAQDNGGALYVDDCSYMGEVPNPRCFFQTVSQNLMINFFNNSANSMGADLFGGLLDRCTISIDSNRTLHGMSHWEAISNLTNLHSISSHPVKVCHCNHNIPRCEGRTLSVKVKRGEKIKVPVVVVDQVEQPVKAHVKRTFYNRSDVKLLDSQALQSTSAECRDLEYNASFPTAGITYKLSIEIDETSMTCKNEVLTNLLVNVEVVNCSCSPGFMPATLTSECYCVCDTQDRVFTTYIKNCDSKSGRVVREGVFWVTYLQDSNVSGYLFFPYCPLDYCQLPGELVEINLSQANGSDAQCSNHRTGLLCGSCLPEYSLSLGSAKCIKCPSNWHGQLVLIVTGAFFAGLVLVLSILVFNLTVAVGTINSIIFYANIIYANKALYFGNSRFLVVASWLNLDIGFDTCFIEGMDTYSKTWLQLAFPVYIIVLVIVIIVIGSYSSRFSNLIGKRDPVATLATLVLLSYTKLLQTVILSFSYFTVSYPNTTLTIRWVHDANIEFGTGKSIALICVAVVILFLGLVYTVLVLCFQCLVKCPRSRLLKRMTLHKLFSFISTYHTPQTARHRYWHGLLLLVRVLTYLVAAFSASSIQPITLISTIVMMCSLLLYKTHTLRVYTNWLLNAMESFVFFNIAIFASFTMFTYNQYSGIGRHETIQRIVANISIGSIILLILGVVLFHIYRYGSEKVPNYVQNSNLYKLIMKSFTDKKRCWTQLDNPILDVIDNPRFESEDNYVPTPSLHLPTRSIVTMTDDTNSASVSTNHSVPEPDCEEADGCRVKDVRSRPVLLELSTFVNRTKSSLSSLQKPLLDEQ